MLLEFIFMLIRLGIIVLFVYIIVHAIKKFKNKNSETIDKVNTEYVTANGIKQKVNVTKNRQIIIASIASLLCITIFVLSNVSFNNSSIESKINNNLNMQFKENYKIELLSKIQNTDSIGCDGSTFYSWKVKGSYKNYYVAYSKRDDIEFYGYLNQTKRNKEIIETFANTYSIFMDIRKNATEIDKIVNNSYENLITSSFVSRYSNDIKDYNFSKKANVYNDLSRVFRNESEYTSGRYYRVDAAGSYPGQGTTIIKYNLSINYNDVVNNYYDSFIENAYKVQKINENFNKYSYDNKFHFNGIEVYFKTSDNYMIGYPDNESYTGNKKDKPSIRVYVPNMSVYDYISFYGVKQND